MSIDILIADDHEVVRAGLRSLLAETDIKVVAEASGGNAGFKLANKHRPDVVLLMFACRKVMASTASPGSSSTWQIFPW